MNKLGLSLTLLSCLAALTVQSQTFEQTHLFTPVHLDSTFTKLNTEDFILNHENVQRVYANSPYEPMLSAEHRAVNLSVDKPGATISPMIFETTTGLYSLLLYRTHRGNYTFKFDPKGKTYSKVQIAGDFNNWNPDKTGMTLNEGVWEAHLYISPAAYKYMLVIDGKWVTDKNNPDSVLNYSQHSYNSLLTVKDNSDKHPLVLNTKSFTDSTVTVTTHGDQDQFFCFWNNESVNLNRTGNSKDYVINIPVSAKAYARSYIQVFSSNGHIAGNEIIIPLKYGKVVTNAGDLTRNDPQHFVVYNITAGDFNTEGIKAIIQKMQDGYYTGLGVNTLAISSINARLENKEAPAFVTAPDKHFTDAALMKQLVLEAHRLNINILLGVVCDRVSSNNPLCKTHADMLVADENNTMYKKFNFTKQTTEAVTDNMISWVKKYGVDGFYETDAQNIPVTFWQTLSYKLKTQIMVPQKRSVFLFGAMQGNRLSENNYTGNGKFNGVGDVSLANDIISTLADTGASMENIAKSVYESGMNFGWRSAMMLSTKEIEHTGTISTAVHNQVQAIKLAMSQIPVISLGDEGGQPNTNKPSKEDEVTLNYVKKMALARKSNIAFSFGETQCNVFDDKVLAISRTYFHNGSVTLINKSDKPQSVTFNVDNADDVFKPTTLFGSKPVVNVYIEKIQTVTIDLPAYGIEVLQY